MGKGAVIKWLARSAGRDQALSKALQLLGIDGGPGSGNFGHSGRPGKVGGSGEGGGSEEKSSGETSAMRNSIHFQGISKAARANKGDYRAFVNAMTPAQKDVLREQYQKIGSQERFPDYVRRMHEMLANEPEAPAAQNKPVDGKDITESYEYNGRSEKKAGSEEIDTLIEDVIHQQGFDGVPKMVSREDFDKIVKEHPEMPILLRSYSAPDEKTLDDYDKQLESGFWYVDCGTGGAQYGQGMYAAGVYVDPDYHIPEFDDSDFYVEPLEVFTDRLGKGYVVRGRVPGWESVDDLEIGTPYLAVNGMQRQMFIQDEDSGIWVDTNTGDILDESKVQKILETSTNVWKCEDRDLSRYEDARDLAREKGINSALEEMSHYRDLNEGRCGTETAQSSTRMMTLDPSAKIITYKDAERIVDGRLTKQEKKAIYNEHLSAFEKDLADQGLSDDQKAIALNSFKVGLDLYTPEDSQRYIRAAERVSDEERKRLLDFGHERSVEAYHQMDSYEKQHQKERQEKFRKFNGDIGVCMAALGYDAINAEFHGESASYTVVLNRTKVILMDQRVDVA